MANIYYRTIKRGTRTFAEVPAELQPEVEALARKEIEEGKITEEQYQEYIGEIYFSI